MYKVYYDNRFISISSQPDRLQKYSLFHKFHDVSDLYKQIEVFINSPSFTSINIYSHTVDHLWKTFLSYFTTLEAAGGLVQNSDRSILFIKRNNRWDIPKGHIEKGESPEECAIREVTEECGISPDGIIYQLKNSYHIYQYHDYYCLKTTYWFFMNYSGKQTPIPQESEGITETVWIGKESLKEVIAGTWLSLIDVINEVRLKFLQ